MPYTEPGSLEATSSRSLAAERRAHERSPTLQRSVARVLLRLVASAASCLVLIGVSVLLIDRPVATWVHNHLGDARFALFTASYDNRPLSIGPFSFMAVPAEALRPAAILAMVFLSGAAVAGRRPKMRGRIVLVLSLAVFVALTFNAQAKAIFGRTWPESWLGSNPSWIRDGVYGFFPFHGGAGWGSFPSGHTTVITTVATLLWLVWPKLRMLWGAAVAVVIVGLIGANYHFLSDIIGGLYLGVAIGLGVAALMLSPEDRLG
jgi:membrane-associated phospholipid phosphatase